MVSGWGRLGDQWLNNSAQRAKPPMYGWLGHHPSGAKSDIVR